MKYLFSVIVGLMLVSAVSGSCLAHGVEGYAEKGEAWCVTARYDDGEPMSYAGVEVKASGADLAFQTGRTDRNGCFVFLPDAPGVWEVVVEDGIGHRLALDVTVAGEGDGQETATDPATPVATSARNKPMGVVAGIAAIFGLCGFYYGWKARRSAA